MFVCLPKGKYHKLQKHNHRGMNNIQKLINQINTKSDKYYHQTSSLNENMSNKSYKEHQTELTNDLNKPQKYENTNTNKNDNMYTDMYTNMTKFPLSDSWSKT